MNILNCSRNLQAAVPIKPHRLKPAATHYFLITLSIFFFCQSKITASDFDQAGRCISLNSNWRFHLGEVYGANNPEFDDSGLPDGKAGWRQLNVPHDWSIEGEFSPENASCTGYLPGGIGWYRKEFNLPETYKSKYIEIQFDGVYQNAEVWINGHYLEKTIWFY
jgi:beta-galactosidase